MITSSSKKKGTVRIGAQIQTERNVHPRNVTHLKSFHKIALITQKNIIYIYTYYITHQPTLLYQ